MAESRAAWTPAPAPRDDRQMTDPDRAGLGAALDPIPRVRLAHTPTTIEPMANLSQHLGIDLHVKRDDCTGIAFGGNKVRQLEFYLGAALSEEADTVLITGAVQSNFARTTAAMARRLGLDCHLQLARAG